MLFVVDERGKENVVPVRLLSREKLGFLNADCVIGNGQGNAEESEARLARGRIRSRARRGAESEEAHQARLSVTPNCSRVQ